MGSLDVVSLTPSCSTWSPSKEKHLGVVEASVGAGTRIVQSLAGTGQRGRGSIGLPFRMGLSHGRGSVTRANTLEPDGDLVERLSEELARDVARFDFRDKAWVLGWGLRLGFKTRNWIRGREQAQGFEKGVRSWDRSRGRVSKQGSGLSFRRVKSRSAFETTVGVGFRDVGRGLVSYQVELCFWIGLRFGFGSGSSLGLGQGFGTRLRSSFETRVRLTFQDGG
ncbi:hypothetical protein TIFTF001_016223 [Ficus carica]|uniref:Uncharacterized protein n=1 Tax=Ficus carica TaxID=3494 RepID=A0AA88A2R3_FICCA|nr:hypothetical protein TIFTF001_016223 [Ficus carica]